MSKKRSTSTRRAESQAASARAAAIRAEQERKERRRRSLLVTGAVVAVLVVILAVFTALRSRDETSTATAPAGTVSGLAVPAGTASAPVTVSVYEDFMCPFCGEFESASRSTFAKDISAGKVRFEYHALSFLDDASSTDYSTRAANALGVVLDSSGPTVAKKFHDLLFENQPKENSAGLSDDKLVDLAVQAGAKESAVRSGIDDLAFEGWVKKVTDDASKSDVNSTPTVKIDGKTLESTTIDGLVAEVQKAVDAG